MLYSSPLSPAHKPVSTPCMRRGGGVGIWLYFFSTLACAHFLSHSLSAALFPPSRAHRRPLHCVAALPARTHHDASFAPRSSFPPFPYEANQRHRANSLQAFPPLSLCTTWGGSASRVNCREGGEHRDVSHHEDPHMNTEKHVKMKCVGFIFTCTNVNVSARFPPCPLPAAGEPPGGVHEHAGQAIGAPGEVRQRHGEAGG